MFQTSTNTNNGSCNTIKNQSPEKVDRPNQEGPGGRDHGVCGNNCRNNSIAKYLFEGKMKDGRISKLTITETGHQATQ